MNNRLIIGIVILVLFSLKGNSQTITKLSEIGFYAKFTPNGENIVFSSSNFQGLKKINLKTSEVEILSDGAGVGYNTIVENDRVLYEFKKEKGSTNIYYFDSKVVKVLKGENKSSVRFKDLSSGKNISNLPIEAKPSSDLSSIELVYPQGIKNEIKIDKSTNKVWVSLSPDRTKVLYTVVGRKTHVVDLKGNIIATIDRAESPTWVNNNTIIYMLTKDNVDYITDSDVYVYSLKQEKSVLLTSKYDVIALFPAMSVDEKKVVFNNDKGELFLINLTK